MGHTVVVSSQAVIANTAQFVDGAATGAYGLIKKDDSKKAEGWSDVKDASIQTGKGFAGGLVYTGKSIGQAAKGAASKDKEQFVAGMKNVGKVAAVATVGVGVFDLLNASPAEAMELDTRNTSLEGMTHETTGVAFEKSTYETADNGVYTGVFPVFDSAFDVELPEDTYLMSDSVHIGIANMQLYEAIQNDPALADQLGLDEQDIENLRSTITPEGYDWHHHEEPGRMQLVDEEQHSLTGHTGGRNLWGGATEARS